MGVSVEKLRKKNLSNLLKLLWHVFRMLLISYKYRFCALVGGWIDKEGCLEYRTSSLYGEVDPIDWSKTMFLFSSV